MTRLAILADIHGNLPALEAVTTDLRQWAADRVIVAGDSINWGPFSAQVVEWITREGWAVIRGNHELYLLDHDTPRAPTAWSDRQRFATLPWLRRQLDGRAQTIIATWPDTLSVRLPDAPTLRILHGTPRSPWNGIYPDVAPEEIVPLLGEVDERTVVAAHTHLRMDREVADWHILNPGSVGAPVDGIFDASYLLLDGDLTGWRGTFRYVPYDREPLFREFERQGFVEECGVMGRLIVAEMRTARHQVIPFLRWRQACFPDRPLTLDLLDEFERADRRAYSPAAYWREPSGSPTRD